MIGEEKAKIKERIDHAARGVHGENKKEGFSFRSVFSVFPVVKIICRLRWACYDTRFLKS
jgi:hypothetical protein